MNRRLLVFALVTGLAASVPVAARQAQSRTVYISLVDRKGQTVRDLKPADITVTEDGQVREVLALAQATRPMKIAVTFDGWGLGRTEVRQGLAGFLATMQDRAEVALFDAGRPDWTILDFTRDSRAAIEAVRNYQPIRGEFERALSSLIDDELVPRFRKEAKEGTGRPIIFAVTNAGGTSSTPEMIASLLRSRITVFAIAGRDNHMNASADASGGRVDVTITVSGIPDAMKRITADILGQYALTYVSPTPSKDGFRLRVKSTTPGVSARAPERVY